MAFSILRRQANVYAILDNDLKKRDLRLGNVAVTPSPDINLLDKKTLESSILSIPYQTYKNLVPGRT